jgi:hypothetical protein
MFRLGKLAFQGDNAQLAKQSGFSSKSEFEAFTEKLWKQLTHVVFIPTDKKIVVLSVDGTGGFRRNLIPGEYCVLIISAHRKQINMLELKGSIYFELVEIQANNESDINAKFEVGY